MITNLDFSDTNLPSVKTAVLTLDNELYTTAHIVKYKNNTIRPQIVLFDKPTKLLAWCKQNDSMNAVNGGFFLRSVNTPLGEMWLNGKAIQTEPFPAPWKETRGCIAVEDGTLILTPRNRLPLNPADALMQVGPTLIMDGCSTYDTNDDPDGFSKTRWQHDEDINMKRFPRSAIATNSEYVWIVTIDGRNASDAGLYLDELADLLLQIGAQQAINLDGGRSATNVHNGQLLNHPRSDYEESVDGYEIHSAIILN